MHDPDADGGELLQLSNGAGGLAPPAWTPQALCQHPPLMAARTLPPPVPVHLLATIHMACVQAARDLRRHYDLCASGHPQREINNSIDSPADLGGGAWWAGGGAVQMQQCHGGWELVCGYAGAWDRAQLQHMLEMRSWGQRSRWCQDSVPEGSSAGLIQPCGPWRMTTTMACRQVVAFPSASACSFGQT